MASPACPVHAEALRALRLSAISPTSTFERLPDTFPLCGYHSHTLAHLHGLPLCFPLEPRCSCEKLVWGFRRASASRLVGDPAFAHMKRVVCLGARLFPIGFITRSTSKRASGYGTVPFLCATGLELRFFDVAILGMV